MRSDGPVALTMGATSEATEADTLLPAPDSRPVNSPVDEVTKRINQTDATGAIGATGPPSRADDVLITSAAVREKLGNCSDMTIWRKLKNDPDFPRPKVMGGRRFWWQSDILAYIASQPTG